MASRSELISQIQAITGQGSEELQRLSDKDLRQILNALGAPEREEEIKQLERETFPERFQQPRINVRDTDPSESKFGQVSDDEDEFDEILRQQKAEQRTQQREQAASELEQDENGLKFFTTPSGSRISVPSAEQSQVVQTRQFTDEPFLQRPTLRERAGQLARTTREKTQQIATSPQARQFARTTKQVGKRSAELAGTGIGFGVRTGITTTAATARAGQSVGQRFQRRFLVPPEQRKSFLGMPTGFISPERLQLLKQQAGIATDQQIQERKKQLTELTNQINALSQEAIQFPEGSEQRFSIENQIRDLINKRQRLSEAPLVTREQQEFAKLLARETGTRRLTSPKQLARARLKSELTSPIRGTKSTLERLAESATDVLTDEPRKPKQRRANGGIPISSEIDISGQPIATGRRRVKRGSRDVLRVTQDFPL